MIRSSMGACFHIPLISLPDWSKGSGVEDYIPNLCTSGGNIGGGNGEEMGGKLHVYAADGRGAKTYDKVK
jgi:hypothetical protein